MMTEAIVDDGDGDGGNDGVGSNQGLSKCVVHFLRKWGFENLRNFLSEEGIAFKYAKKRKGMTIGFVTFEDEMSEVVGSFNHRAQNLLELHLASGYKKYFFGIKGKLQGNHTALIQEGKDLVTYALINAIAIQKILKKYDKIHYSNQGQLFKSQVQSMHKEILQSPWHCELMAFHINLRETKVNSRKEPALFDGCSLTLKDRKPSITCEFFDSIKIDIDLTCSICLDRVFHPVYLTCGHIFCYICACSAASVSIVNRLKAADPKVKCHLCREGAVYGGAVHLEELNILLGRSCQEYWKQKGSLVYDEQMKSSSKDLDGKSIGNKKVKVADVIPQSFDKKSNTNVGSHQELDEENTGVDAPSSGTLDAETNNDNVAKTRSVRDVVTPLAHMAYADQLV